MPCYLHGKSFSTVLAAGRSINCTGRPARIVSSAGQLGAFPPVEDGCQGDRKRLLVGARPMAAISRLAAHD